MVFFKGVSPGRSVCSSGWMASHPGEHGKHELNFMGYLKKKKRQHEVEMGRKVEWIWRSLRRGVTMVKIHEILK